jgi:hypothetical protein
MKNSNGNAVIILIIAMLILGLIIFSIGNQGSGTRKTSPVVRDNSEYNSPPSETRKFDLQTKKIKVHQSISEGINTIDKALEDLQ